jgi:membrane protein DedA with SNARE-associated domain
MKLSHSGEMSAIIFLVVCMVFIIGMAVGFYFGERVNCPLPRTVVETQVVVRHPREFRENSTNPWGFRLPIVKVITLVN